ncbi:MAG: class I SAM-dependent methyltransferase [Candidatus Omnitrophica bacterium]|nr:class I SAM-dependent methyltransferase [Candidatus Omnitrophota bacterium]
MNEGLAVFAKSLIGLYRWEPLRSCPNCEADRFAPHSTHRFGPLAIRLRSCGSCGLVAQSPRLTEPSLRRFYASDYHAHQGGRGAAHAAGQFERGMRRGAYIVRWLDEQGIRFRGGLVFELGCSYGGVLEAFRREGCRVQGCDVSAEAVAYGAARGLDLAAGSLEALPRAEQPADLILLSHVLEHVADPQRLLQRMRAALAPRGVLYVEVPGMRNPRTQQRRYAQPAHLWYFTLETARRVVEANGFRFMSGNEVVQGVFCPDAEAPVGASTT